MELFLFHHGICDHACGHDHDDRDRDDHALPSSLGFPAKHPRYQLDDYDYFLIYYDDDAHDFIYLLNISLPPNAHARYQPHAKYDQISKKRKSMQ